MKRLPAARPAVLDDGALAKVVQQAIARAERREILKAEIRRALLAGEKDAACTLMCQFLGIPTTTVMP